MARPGEHIERGLLGLIEQALNRALSMDPDSRLRLQPLLGRRLAVRVSDPAVAVDVGFEAAGLCLERVADDAVAAPADATLRASAGGLLTLALSRGRRSRDVSFEGDVGLIQEIRRLFSELDMDWEELVSKVTGDGVAHRLGEATREGASHLRGNARRVLANTGEYLTEERRLIPTRVELDDFSAAVDRLRNDSERLEARIRRLERGR